MLSRKLLLPLILAIAFGLRAVAGLGVHHYLHETLNRDFLIQGDANGYWVLGQKLAAGEKYQIYALPRQVLRMPGFPAFLALSMKITGDSFLGTRMLLAIVGTVACGLVYLLGRELFDHKIGLLAAGLTAVSPTMIGFSVLILSETLFAACLVGSLIVFAKVARADRDDLGPVRANGLSLLAGALVAVACYVRPSWLLAAPCFVVLLVVLSATKQRALVNGVWLFAGVAITLMPWTIRNYQTTGKWVVTTLWVGPSLYDGLNPAATGDSDMSFFDRDNLMSRMSEYDVDRHYRRKAWDFVVAHPGRTLELAALKLIRFWKPWPNDEQFRGLWQRLAVALFFVPVCLLAVRGWWVTRSQPWSWLLTVGPIIYFSAIHAVFVGSLRYRLPVEYPLCVMSAVGIQSLLPTRTESAA